MNVHIHYVNGVSFTHSHPNNGAHTHSNAEILLLNRLGVFYSLKAEGYFYHSYQQPVAWIIKTEQKSPLIASIHWDSLTLRAPPTNI